MAVTQPVWSRIDEAPNADFIVQLSHGVYPVADTTILDPETMQVLYAEGFFSPLYRSASGLISGPPPDPTDTDPIPTGMSDRVNGVWMKRHIWQLSRESDQTPVYYLLMAPVWWAVDRLGGTLAAIYAIRVIGALIIATLAPMAVATARILTPSRPEVAVLAALFAVLLPGLDLNGTRISNDVLAAGVGGLFVLLAVRWAASPWTWRRAILLGLVLGVGLMTKLTVAGLLPALAFSVLWPAAGSTWRTRLARLAVSGAVAIACLAPWFLLNLHIYGGITPGYRAIRLEASVPGTLTPEFVVLDLTTFVVTWWTGEPWGVLPLALAFAVLGSFLALMAPVGVVQVLRNRARSFSGGPVVVAVVAVGGMAAAALSLPATAQYEFVGHGRFAYPAVAPAAALCALGLCTVLTRPLARRAVGGIYAVAAVGILAAGGIGLHSAPALAPGPGTPPADARIVTVSASGQLQGVTITINRIAFDPGAKATWFEVTASNSSQAEADWPAVPVASFGGSVVSIDYLRSTHLPGDIDGGQSVTGWLFVAIDPATVHGGDPVLMRFIDVAVDNYRTVQDVDVYVDIGTSGTAA